MNWSAYMKARRESARAEGFCTHCFRRESIPGAAWCGWCQERDQERPRHKKKPRKEAA